MLNMTSKEVVLLSHRVSPSSPMQPDTPITYCNDLDIAKDGTIYFTDSVNITTHRCAGKGAVAYGAVAVERCEVGGLFVVSALPRRCTLKVVLLNCREELQSAPAARVLGPETNWAFFCPPCLPVCLNKCMLQERTAVKRRAAHCDDTRGAWLLRHRKGLGVGHAAGAFG